MIRRILFLTITLYRFSVKFETGYTTDESKGNSQKDEMDTLLDMLHFSLKSYQVIFFRHKGNKK